MKRKSHEAIYGNVPEVVALHTLNLMPDNYRVHDDDQIKFLRERLARVGQTRPLIVSRRPIMGVENPIIAGNGVFQAMMASGWTEAEILWYDMPEAEAIAESIADNRSHERGAVDDEALLRSLTRLREYEYSLEMAGYSEADFNKISDEIARREEEISGALRGIQDSGGGLSNDDEEPDSGDKNDTVLQFGEFRTVIPREVYLEWRDAIREDVGFSDADILKEMKRRLGIENSPGADA